LGLKPYSVLTGGDVVAPPRTVRQAQIERAPYLGETRLTIGEPFWKTLDRESVEALVGQAV
jgi:hypothetical protein